MVNIILMDFTAKWCGPCKAQDPIIEEIKEKFGGKIEFKKIDVDENGKLVVKYNIMGVPTLIIEKDGAVFKRYVGITSPEVLTKDIEEVLEQIEKLSE